MLEQRLAKNNAARRSSGGGSGDSAAYQLYELCYQPVIECSGQHAIRPRGKGVACEQLGASSDEGVVEYDAVVVSIGVKYRECCANVARTIVFAPTSQQRTHYNMLLRARGAALAALAPGGTTADVYSAVVAELENSAPDLLPHLTKTVGHGIGEMFKDKLALSGKRAVALKAGQVFNLQLGLAGLPTSSSSEEDEGGGGGGGGGGGAAADAGQEQQQKQTPKTYALVVADTVALVALPGNHTSNTNGGSGSAYSSAIRKIAAIYPEDDPAGRIRASSGGGGGGGSSSSSSSSSSGGGKRSSSSGNDAKRARKIPSHPGAQVLTRADPHDTTLVCRRGGQVRNERLPYEILVRIFAMLDVISLGRASMVCTTWNAIRWPEADFGVARQMINWEQKRYAAGVAPAISTSTNGTGRRGNRFMGFSAPIIPAAGRTDAHSIPVLASLTKQRHAELRRVSFEGCEKLLYTELRVLPRVGAGRLTELNLNHSKVLATPDACTLLAAFLQHRDCVLGVLELAHCLLDGMRMALLVPALSGCETLVVLRLQQNLLGDSGAKSLAEVVKQNPSLRAVPLGPLGDGAHSLGSLWQNTTIGRIGVNALLKSHPDAKNLFEAPATFKVVSPMAAHVTKYTKFGGGGGGSKSKRAVDDAAFEIDWRQVVVHFGKNKGMEVWQLSTEQLSWYAIEWKGKGSTFANSSQQDAEFSAAVNVALREISQGTHAPPKFQDELQNGMSGF